MNAKIGIALAVVFTIVWIGFKMTRPRRCATASSTTS